MPEQRRFLKIEHFQQPLGWDHFHRADPKHSRFGNIQKIRTKRSDVYKLIMATNDAKMQAVSIQCRILQSTAQFQLYDGTSFEMLDQSISPIIDLFDTSDMQVYHPIRANNRAILSVKLYPFSGYTDNILKRGVYQIYLYGQMRSMSPLLDYFIMTKEKISTLVMIFKRYQTSLHEIICYRQMAKFPWSEQELLFLWKMLIDNYKVMHLVGISHRDIRPSKVFYTSESKNTPFQFANLATARKLTKAQADNDLLTVNGVDQFVQQQLKIKIRNGDNLASYNSFKADRKALQNLLYSTLHLDALWKKDKVCQNSTLAPIIQMLKDDKIDFQSIEHKIQSIIKDKKYDKQDLFSIDKIISDHLAKMELRRLNRERIEDSHLYSLMRLHKREALSKWLIQKLQQNQANGMKYDNIVLMHKVAEYFESVGIQKNDYFVEEFSLLLELAKQCRLQEYYSDHQQHINHLTTLLPKIPKQNNDLFISYHNELTLFYLYHNKKDQANRQLNKLLQQSERYNDSNVALQLEVLITKVHIEMANKKYDTVENTIEKIGLIITTGNFSSYYDSNFYKAQFQYLTAYQSLELMLANREQVKPKRILSAERSISNSLSLYTNLPISNENIVKIINASFIQSDLLSIKEAYAQSRKSLQSAQTLMSQLQKTRSLSDNLKMKSLKRLKAVLEKANKANEPVYKTTIDKIAKIQAKFQNSNADRHRISKELRDKQKNKAKRQKRLKQQQAIQEENEDSDI